MSLRLVSRLFLLLIGALLASVLGILLLAFFTSQPGMTPDVAAETTSTASTVTPLTRATSQPATLPPVPSVTVQSAPAVATAVASATTTGSGDALAQTITATPVRPPASTATVVPGIVLPGRFEAEDYKPGGEGVGYHDWTRGNAGTAYRSDDVDIERCTDGDPCYDVGWTAAGEWLAYDVRVPSSGTYTFTVRVAAQSRGGRFHIELNGLDVTGPILVPRTGSYAVWTDVVSQNVSIAAGSYELRLVADSTSFNWNYVVVADSSTTPE